MIQIAKLVGGFENVVATASRPETEEWVKSLGATHVINHRKDLAEELKRIGINSVDVSFCCVDLELHYDKLVEVTNMVVVQTIYFISKSKSKTLILISFERVDRLLASLLVTQPRLT